MWPCARSPVSLRGFLISPLVEVIIQIAIREMQLSDSWWELSLWQQECPLQPPSSPPSLVGQHPTGTLCSNPYYNATSYPSG